MNENTRTLTFVATAAISLVLAWLLAPTLDLRPESLANARLNEEFFPDFKDPNAATSLTVASYNADQGLPRLFSVEFKNGLWTIPSVHNYPADGAERLARTSASAIGIRREELRSGSNQDWVELGVVDPTDEDASKTQGRGQKITIKKGEEILFDLIVGKGVKNRPGYYYVRKPGENSTYVSKLDIDLSTKFADWVETDLLKIDRDGLTLMALNDYSIDEQEGRLIQKDVLTLSREKSADPWTLSDADGGELQTARVNDMVNALDDLKLAGVRPKPRGLSEDLKLDQGITLDPITAIDLQRKGFMVARGQLLSNEGEFVAATSKGVVYTLRFGEVFTGDENEVAAGIEADKAKEKAEKKADTPKTGGSNRYLFVTCAFDEKYLGTMPTKPAKPGAPPEEPAANQQDSEKPAADEPATDKSTDKPEQPDDAAPPEATSTGEANAPGAAASGTDADTATDAADKEAENEESPKADDVKADAEAEKAYQDALTKYEADLEAWNAKVKAGQEEAARLNRRFADWYYVISADSYSKLHVTRAELVKPKAATEPKVDGETKPEGDVKPEGEAKPPTDPTEPQPESEAKPDGDTPPKGEATPEPNTQPEAPQPETGAKPESAAPPE